ncbi:hypothetical protein TRIHO_23090 [Tritonibacter horizontis]|uniref:Nudix hydrolase domain-containing protein n=2 Tax=Tritonibacter horizontis TaxID=1768241 RepID=A0A132BWV6_9RHOB|nr:hypothetical protein TRIHO_23090 [Tritonibacter horizontis]
MKVLFGMALRQTTGFGESLLRLVGLDWSVPDFSTLSRRQKTLAVNIPYGGSKGPLHLLIDSTGIKVEDGSSAQIVTSVNSALLLPTAATVAAIQHSETAIRCSCNIGPLSIGGSVDKADEVAGSCSNGVECAKVQLSMTDRKGATHRCHWENRSLALLRPEAPIMRSAIMEICIAAAAILREDGAILLVRKRGTSAFMQPGGKIDGLETPVNALRRELFEELALDLQPKEAE